MVPQSVVLYCIVLYCIILNRHRPDAADGAAQTERGADGHAAEVGGAVVAHLEQLGAHVGRVGGHDVEVALGEADHQQAAR